MSSEYEKDPGWQYLRRSQEQIQQDQSRPYDSKKNVWIPDAEEGYVAAEIKSTKNDNVVVTVGDQEKTLRKDLVQEMNPPKFEKTEDMSNLTFLNDASVLHNLRSRYASMLIYTYSGLFCVVINPYKRLPIYTESVAAMFMGKRRAEMPPHLFAVSDEAYRNMLMNKENQSMLITGESGAGKTENTKKVICYFASVGASQQKKTNNVEKQVTLEDQIVQTNPVLEAFGNAKTVRNNNSSRFGKFIRIHFSKQGRVASCDIEHYLLEKSRVIRQAPGERCYHIFYQIFSDYKPELKKQLLLDKPLSEYSFVAQAELTIDGVHDNEEFQLTDEAFDILNFSTEEKMDCYRLMAGHMHMGAMKFKQRPREEQAEPDGQNDAEKAAAMYGVDVETFLKALVSPKVKVGSEWVSKGQNVDQVNWAVGAMAKGLYARVFHWLVKKCNLTLDQQGMSRDFFIGVLDIAGFEIFDFNSFEQLWINFVNEKLQQFFNHHMFILEQEEYAREGIQWTFIDFGLDLQACIELIEKPLGIISMLDEECIVPKATDLTLAQKLNEQHLGKHPNFEKPKPPKGKQSEAHFAMRHYAGTVRYNVTNWLEKNKDPLNDTVVSVMKASKGNDLLVEIWKDYVTQEEASMAAKCSLVYSTICITITTIIFRILAGGGGKKKGKSGSFMTVSMLYRESLNSLMNMLHKTHPHFIRCIIPNEKKASGVIDASLVLNQLTCNGVLEGIRICRKGFPNRTLHSDFVHRYYVLGAKEAKASEDPKVCTEAILRSLVMQDKLKDEQFRIGHTKVFFRAGVVAHIEDLRDQKINQLITGIQSSIRYYNAILEYHSRKRQHNSYVILQRNIRSWSILRTWDWFLLFGKIRPSLKCSRMAEEIAKMAEQQKTLETEVLKIEKDIEDKEELYNKLICEQNRLLEQLEITKGGSTSTEEKLNRLNSYKQELDKRLNEISEKLSEQENKNSELEKQKRKVFQEIENIKLSIEAVDGNLLKSIEEKEAKENRIQSLQEEINMQDETISKLNRDKKYQEEVNHQLIDELHNEEAKQAQAARIRQKLEQTLDELEESIERERRVRTEIEKSKRRIEGELKSAAETIDEMTKVKQEIDVSLQKKETDFHTLSIRIEDEQALSSRLNRQSKENMRRIITKEDELEHERQLRAKADRAKSELQRDVDDLNDRLDEQSSQMQVHNELNKKKDVDVLKFGHDLDGLKMAHDDQMASLKKKDGDHIAQLTDHLNALQKNKVKIDKEKSVLQKELDDINVQINQDSKLRVEQENLAKQYEIQIIELQQKVDEQCKQIVELTKSKGRLLNENSDLMRQVDDLELHLNNIERAKAGFSSQLIEAKKAIEEETREAHDLNVTCKNLEHEIEQGHEMLEEEINSKDDVQRQLTRINSEIAQWKTRYEGEGLVGRDELEDIKRKQMAHVMDLQETLSSVQSKVISLEKAKGQLLQETEEARSDVNRHLTVIASLEKKQTAFNKVIEDWKDKVESIQRETDATNRDSRDTSTEVFKLKSALDNLTEHIETLRRENKCYTQDIRDLKEQISQSVRTLHELQKTAKRTEQEKEELQHALDEAEAALEAEEGKALRSQVEVQQIRSDLEKRIQEKEEEFGNTRKNHQRVVESIQASLETEAKSKAELLRTKKKLENDINQLEIALDLANRANVDTQKTLKRLIDHVKDLQGQIDDEQRHREEIRENYLSAEKRLAIAFAQSDDYSQKIDSAEKLKRDLDLDHADLKSENSELVANSTALSTMKRKLESDVQIARNELDDCLNELKASEERARKAAADADRLTEEVRHEQEHASHVDRHRKGLELNIKDLQVKIEDAERVMLQFGQKALTKVEEKVRAVSAEYNAEQRRYQEALKGLTKEERRVKELQFQVEEDKKMFDRLQEMVEKLQQKIRVQKKQIEEAEEVATQNLSKFRQIQLALESAEERADVAENSLARMRTQKQT
ncbi:myosin head [Dictyocaulus viviparus]|uniref:Myosin head n=1 Tax=Dictyocaulus viviparus TaxID=29172 RepID=A0A0D8Y5J2_DICVI|nr:myosin head [Dictyocaulus viviparus]